MISTLQCSQTFVFCSQPIHLDRRFHPFPGTKRGHLFQNSRFFPVKDKPAMMNETNTVGAIVAKQHPRQLAVLNTIFQVHTSR